MLRADQADIARKKLKKYLKRLKKIRENLYHAQSQSVPVSAHGRFTGGFFTSIM
jgi:hypothetical protein